MVSSTRAGGASLEPLTVERIVAACPDDYLAGDPYEVEILLNRELDPYEQRAARVALRELRGFTLDYDRLRTRSAVDEIDPFDIAEFVRTVAHHASDLRQQGDVEREELRATTQQLLDSVRRHA